MEVEKKRLPGWAWMVAGLLIIAYTKFIQAKNPEAQIGIFFWVGIAFIMWGALREFLPRIMKKKVKREAVGPPPHHTTHHHLNPQVSQHATHQHTSPQQHPSHPYQPAHKQCPRCHKLTYGQGKFCHNCGHQFY
jgi:uncharacterized paraquat-inducible protein A